MALTKQQWYDKLKGWVPAWVFEGEDVNKAIFMALAATLVKAQEDSESLFDQTFIENAEDGILDLLGAERSIFRLTGETDESYRERIRNINNTTSYSTLLQVLTSVLNNGVPTLIENWNHGFADDELFADCTEAIYISKTKNYNRFTVIIPAQTVFDDSYFRSAIISVLDENKALGVFYDVIYAVLVFFQHEDGDQLITENGDYIIGETD